MSRQSRWEYLRQIQRQIFQSLVATRNSRSSTSSASIAGTSANTRFACSTVLLPTVATSAPEPACDLWACGDLCTQDRLGSGWLSLVGPSEGAIAGVDALGSETLSLDAPAGTATARLSPRPSTIGSAPKSDNSKNASMVGDQISEAP